MSFKTAFLFPGQGAQAMGMGLQIYETYDAARSFFNAACEEVDFDLKSMCFEETGTLLSQTEYTQPALVAVEGMIVKVLEEKGLIADAYAGLSLGEYSALAAAGALDFTAAVRLAGRRGKIMAQALPKDKTAMAAILGMDGRDAAHICKETEGIGLVEVANYNCPGQVVIGGEREAVRHASALAKSQGARRVVPLNVSGAFHTSLLTEAGTLLRLELDQMDFNPLQKPVVFDTTADYQQQPLKDLLQQQISSPVLFEDSIRRLIRDGVDTFVEIGPGKTLSGFVKKIDRNVTLYQISDVKSLEQAVKKLLPARDVEKGL